MKSKPATCLPSGDLLQRVLFLGLPVTPAIAVDLSNGHAPSIAFFISENQGLYIEKRCYQGVFYLGKTLGVLSSLEELKSAHQHLKSLLCRVLDESHVKREDFVLFALS